LAGGGEENLLLGMLDQFVNIEQGVRVVRGLADKNNFQHFKVEIGRSACGESYQYSDDLNVVDSGLVAPCFELNMKRGLRRGGHCQVYLQWKPR